MTREPKSSKQWKCLASKPLSATVFLSAAFSGKGHRDDQDRRTPHDASADGHAQLAVLPRSRRCPINACGWPCVQAAQRRDPSSGATAPNHRARSYQNLTLGLALLLLAAAVLRAATWIPRPVVAGIALSGLAYLAQGWVVGAAGFSAAESMAIVAAFVLDVLWMSWLLVIALADPAKSRRFHR